MWRSGLVRRFSTRLADEYQRLIKAERIRPDPHQLAAVQALERVTAELSKPQSTGWFASPQSPPRGAYLHGGVGCGKSFLMNLFFDCTENTDKQKIHFHSFMLRVHQQMHTARQNKEEDLFRYVIDDTMEQGRLLCLDEFQVTDVADAMILHRLFQGLWKEGCIVVATSNRPPRDLYLDGLQRDRFLPFIDELQQRCEVVNMSTSETDYRLVQKLASGSGQVYFIGDKTDYDALFYRLADRSAIAPTSLQTQGRKVSIPQASVKKGLARFSFADLCKKALGAADYLIIAEHFHTVFVEDIQPMTLAEVNWMRRFITFIDVMYEAHVKVVLHASVRAAKLFVQEGNHDEVFAFHRTLSRLEEMSSQSYLEQGKWTMTRSKAELLSRQQATVRMEPSLSDTRVH